MQPSSIAPGTPVLVTGGTGFTGSHLIRRLVKDGVSVRAIARRSSNIEAFSGLPVQWFHGDIYDPNLIREAMSGVHYVFHLAACYRDPKADTEEYAKVHIDSTKLLVHEALKNPEFERFIHTSTIGVHGHIMDPPANEEAPYSPGDVYQETKLEAELWLREFGPENGLPFTIVRPAAIFGPGDRRLLKLFKFAKRGWCPLLDHHNTLYHLIHVDDLVNFYLTVAAHPAALQEVFICGNEVPTDVKSIIEVLGKFFDKKTRFISLPSGPLFILADCSEAISKLLKVAPILYRRRLAFFTKDRSFDTSKSRRLLNFRCKFDNSSGLLQTAEAYKKAGWI